MLTGVAHATENGDIATTTYGSSLWQSAEDRVSNIADNGDNILYLSGYAHHGRGTYTPEKLHELNERAWGIGGGKTLRDAAGNDESLYVFGLSDSHRKPQLMAGYAYEWNWKPVSQFEIGLGYTAMLMSRQDIFGGVPFPIVLPLASFGPRNAKLMMSYVPRLSKNKGNGDVLLMFLRINLS